MPTRCLLGVGSADGVDGAENKVHRMAKAGNLHDGTSIPFMEAHVFIQSFTACPALMNTAYSSTRNTTTNHYQRYRVQLVKRIWGKAGHVVLESSEADWASGGKAFFSIPFPFRTFSMKYSPA